MSRKGDKHWSAEEKQYLLEHYETTPIQECSNYLNRTYQGIRGQAQRLKLTYKRYGAANGNWKGGLSYLKSGYVRNNVTNKNIHTETIEEYLGRKLIKGEIIHHIDGDKSNNKLENLLLCESISEHRKLHGSLEKAAYEFVKSGRIKFLRDERRYILLFDSN